MAKRDEIVLYLDDLLKIKEYEDSSVNGLQVQGKEEIAKIALSTDAAMDTYKKAVEQGAQMLLTHHGLIWEGIKSVTGRDYTHIKYLLDNGLNLYGCHLPLDAHPTLGNPSACNRFTGTPWERTYCQTSSAVQSARGLTLNPEQMNLFSAATSTYPGVALLLGLNSFGLPVPEGEVARTAAEEAQQEQAT